MTQPIGESGLEKTPGNESDTATDRSMELSAVLARAQSGDQRAFETLYRATVDKVYGLCLRMTANPAMAEDCVQQTYIQAWRNLARFRGGSTIGTWLHRIAVNEVLGHHRKEQRHQHLRHQEADAEPTGISSDADRQMDIEQAIAELPEQARRVFVLFGVYGYPHRETAAMLNIAVGTSKAHYHRARRQLQKRLGELT